MKSTSGRSRWRPAARGDRPQPAAAPPLLPLPLPLLAASVLSTARVDRQIVRSKKGGKLIRLLARSLIKHSRLVTAQLQLPNGTTPSNPGRGRSDAALSPPRLPPPGALQPVTASVPLARGADWDDTNPSPGCARGQSAAATTPRHPPGERPEPKGPGLFQVCHQPPHSCYCVASVLNPWTPNSAVWITTHHVPNKA
jgi:hypothetical protein